MSDARKPTGFKFGAFEVSENQATDHTVRPQTHLWLTICGTTGRIAGSTGDYEISVTDPSSRASLLHGTSWVWFQSNHGQQPAVQTTIMQTQLPRNQQSDINRGGAT